jgi:hypothetical protein
MATVKLRSPHETPDSPETAETRKHLLQVTERLSAVVFPALREGGISCIMCLSIDDPSVPGQSLSCCASTHSGAASRAALEAMIQAIAETQS